MIEIFGKKSKETYEILRNLPLAYVKFRINYDLHGKPYDLTFLDANDHLIKIADLDHRSLIGKKIAEVSPHLKAIFSDKFIKDIDKIKPGSVYELEIYIEQTNKWYDLHVSIPDPDTAIILLSDCTIRKKLEEDLMLSEHKFKSLFINSFIGIYTSTPEGNLIAANPSLLRTLGFSSFEELVENNPLSGAINSGFSSKVLLSGIGNDESVKSSEYQCSLKSGRTIFIREYSKTIHDYNGKPLYIETSVEDITEKKKSALQIEELTKLFLELGEDHQKNISSILHKACDIVNGSCSFYNLLDESRELRSTISHYNDLKEGFDEFFQKGQLWHDAIINDQNAPVIIEDLLLSDYKDTDQNKKKINWRSFIGMPVVFDEQIVGVLGIIGLQPRKFAENDIKIISTMAKALAIEQHRYNIQNELLRADNEVRIANQAKSRFLANISHELRTPLNGIIGFAEMLAGQETDERKARLLSMIEDSGYQLLQIINDLISYSKLEAKKVILKSEIFALDEIIEETAGSFQKAIHDKDLYFTVNTDEVGEKMLVGDLCIFKQVLINLISNAIKFTNEGTIILRVESKKKADSIEVKLIIEDTGIGIYKAQLDKIFDDFMQLEFYLTKKTKGIGLGLSITKKLLDLMSGNIEVESEPGKGSRFTVTIPFKSASCEPIKNKEENMDKSKNNSSPAGKRVKILLAEDNEANQFLIKAITKSQEWDISIVENGIQAVEKYKSGQYDIILMDVQMPEMNGYEATKIIRQIESEKGIHTPIIALTAYAMKSDKDICIESGMDDYISKPFKRQQFLDSINDIISKM